MRFASWRGLPGDRCGVTALEFAILLPFFATLVLGMMQVSQVLWTQMALQHAVEMAARCASINAASCGNPAQTQAYAAGQVYGMTLPAGTFVASAAACGNQVLASLPYTLDVPLVALPAMTLTARSCYPA